MIKFLRKIWSGREDGCFRCKWDDPRAATRTCVKCGRRQVMSHL